MHYLKVCCACRGWRARQALFEDAQAPHWARNAALEAWGVPQQKRPLSLRQRQEIQEMRWCPLAKPVRRPSEVVGAELAKPNIRQRNLCVPNVGLRSPTYELAHLCLAIPCPLR